MADSVNGIENSLCQGYQSVEHFGNTLLDDAENVLMHPINTIGQIGSTGLNAAAYAVQNPFDAVSNVGSATLSAAGNVANTGADYATKVGSAALGAVKKSVSFVGETAENAYANVMEDQPRQVYSNVVMEDEPRQVYARNLDKVSNSGLPMHHTQNMVPLPVEGNAPAPRVVRKRKGYLKTIVNWTILLLVIVLIGVLVFLTCKRYILAGNAYMSGNNMMTAVLLSPELSTGLSTLAATL
jgi:hypothetical protein